jgi:hypothetical protein
MLGNWELNKNSVDSGIEIEPGNFLDKLCLGDGIGVLQEFAFNTCLSMDQQEIPSQCRENN